MGVNHDFEVVEKTITFPINNVKLFKVNDKVLAAIYYIINAPLSPLYGVINIGEQDSPTSWSMGTSNEPAYKRKFRAVSGDLYLTTKGKEIEAGEVIYYCIFAKLSADSGVEAAEE